MIKRVPPADSTGAKFAKQRSVKVSRGVKLTKDGREICTDPKEYRRRTIQMAERQGWKCGLCGKHMSMADLSFEHSDLRGGGKRNDTIERYQRGGKWIQNMAAHGSCNGRKGSVRL